MVEDRLLPGHGVARVFYEYDLGEAEPDPDAEADEETGETPTFQPVTAERAPIRYVFWQDYHETPARVEKEIWWKAYRSYLTRDELVKRFDKEKGEACSLDYSQPGLKPAMCSGSIIRCR